MRVGISILCEESSNVWNNGIGQNVFHLARLIECLPFVESVVLLNTGIHQELPQGIGASGRHFKMLGLKDATDVIDVAIEMSGGLNCEWIRLFRARGGKVVAHVCGQPHAAFAERTIFGQSTFFSDAERCDEIWYLPKDRQFSSMFAGIHRCPAFEVPYLWSPHFLQESIARDALGLSFGYQCGTLLNGQARPAIFEPNISPIKMGLIPYMICESVERLNSAMIANVQLMNSDHLTSHPTFVSLISNSETYKAGKVSFAGRDYFAKVMASGANIVVAHQIDCDQNYLYLDALYGGYPLLHNSHDFSDVGYFYNGSNIAEARDLFVQICRDHDAVYDSYTKAAECRIMRLSPDDQDNQRSYARRLLDLVNSAAPALS